MKTDPIAVDVLSLFAATPSNPQTFTAGVLMAAVWVALAVDRWWGEPPVRLHPVVWMGNYLGWAGRRLQRLTRQKPNDTPDYKAFWLGALAWIAGAALVLIATVGLQHGLERVTVLAQGQGSAAHAAALVLAAVLLGVLLKPLLAWAMLQREVLAVEQALSNPVHGSLQGGRERLRWLVSRDVAALSEAEVRESAIETLAENLNDSVVAPLFWFALLGLPGAAVFRFANTADAMWGYPGVYQGRQWQWAGKWAARADDVLCWIPARITALLLLLVAGGFSLARLRAEARRTPSPNSGWPMAAMALALNIRLGKPGAYVLNADGRSPERQDSLLALSYASKALLALVVIAQAAIVLVAIVSSA